jgi:hypothetical protein
MTKNVALLISMGILFMASGCSKTQQGSAESIPAAEAATLAPAPPELPPVSGHWTITFKRLQMKKEDGSFIPPSFIPGTGKNVGVLNVDLKDGMNVIDGKLLASCTQNGNEYGLNGFPNLNIDVPLDDGKPTEACFTSVGSFDGSSGQLSHTAAVLVTADYKMEQQSWQDMAGETEKVPASTKGRPARFTIKFDDDSTTRSFDGFTAISGNVMSGEWCDAHNCGTLFGQRTSD